MGFELRDYQQECVDKIDNEGSEGRHLVAMATGLGKSLIFASIRRKGRTLILSHRDELVRQPEKYYLGCSFGVEKAEEHANGEDVVSASVQSLSRDSRLEGYAPDAFHTIIIDEAHHAAAPTYKKILGHFSGAKQVIGVTATPKRGDGVRLSDVFDDIIFSRDLRWGIENGWLCGIRCERVVASYKLTGVKVTAGDFNVGELDDAIDTPTIAIAAKTYVGECHAAGRHTLIYCPSVRTCASLVGTIRNLLPDAERSTVTMLTGETDPDERRQMLDDYKNGKVRCIVNCMVLTEGTDLPICDTVINMRPTCNPSLYQQMLGRSTRLYDGKEYSLVIDIIPDDERKIRNLCTAPTLFGIDPSRLPKDVTERFNKETDLIELCDEIAGTIGVATDVAKRMEVSVALAEAFIREQTALLIDPNDGVAGLKAAAGRITDRAAQELAEYDLDFGDLFVTVRPDAERKFMIKPNWGEEIYVSEPDVLGNVTVDFYVAKVKTSSSQGEQGPTHYINNMPFDDAVALIRKYCTLMPEYMWYSWNRTMRDAWDHMPATDNQMRKLYKCYAPLGFTRDSVVGLSKLEASTLIDTKLTLDEKCAYAEEFTIQPRQRKATKEKKKEAFLALEAERLNGVASGRDAFPEFEKALNAAYEIVDKQRRDEEARIARRQKETKEAKAVNAIQVNVKMTSYRGCATDRQEGFIQSLVHQAASRGYILDDSICVRALSRAEASIVIDALLQITRKNPLIGSTRVSIDADAFVGLIQKAASENGSGQQKIEIAVSPYVDAAPKTKTRNRIA